MRIFLIGYMGSGKTRTGKLLARGLDFEFMDIDQLFEEKYKISIQDFFRKYDEAAFRKLEHDLLEETIHRDNVVFSMGGGTPCFHGNMEMLKRSGLTIYIRMPASALAQRLHASRKQRPILHGMPPKELLDHIKKQLSHRDAFYSQADLTVEGTDLDMESLIRLVRQHQVSA